MHPTTVSAKTKMSPMEKKSALPDGCDLCDDAGPLFVHQRCHPTAPLRAIIEDSVLTLRCYVPECGRVVGKFKVTDITD